MHSSLCQYAATAHNLPINYCGDDSGAEECALFEDANYYLKSPVKLGDKMWFIEKYPREIRECILTRVEFDYREPFNPWLSITYISRITGTRLYYNNRSDRMLGKNLFFTKEEAEQILREVQSE